ncbi:lysophosphatidic acid receptor 6a isoform X2 [Hippocampus zosterae]|uniref:lysophosphatidic acid receptor 6a isoform X2 n=1 Tax=Hippocampus zosterae TaxID=109293 RepID=UPI00223D70C4|nr:lysophosphatidic acid receptor 6a isoform X2 [Hippocampus zosterae]
METATLNAAPPPGWGNVSAGNWSCSKNDGFKYPLYSTVFSVVFVVGLITNAVAIYIFTCSLKLRNETTTYMMNLVASDLLFVFTLPLRVFYFINGSWPFGSVLCKVSVSLFYTNMYGSILFLTCISVDRFLAIVHPFRSRTLRTQRNAKLVCAAVWALVLSGSLPTGFLLDTTSRQRANATATATFCFENFSSSQWKSHLSKVVIFIETVGFVIPLLLNVGCSVRVLQTLRRPHKTLKGCLAESVVRTIYPVALCIAVSNCCFDPIVYYFTSETIQNSIKRKSPAGRTCDGKFSEALRSDSGSDLQCSLRNLKAKMLHESSV